MKEVGIYIHIPFCKSKCYYCDFCSFAKKENLINDYIKCLIYEIKQKSNKNYFVKTIFIGGGTPSYINSNFISEIMQTIKEYYNVYDEAEVTIEANPGTCNEEKFKDYIKSGINRLSLGLQSSNNDILKEIGRIHTFEEYERALELAKKAGFNNINSDIIIGIPNQTISDVDDTINKLIKLNLNHISVYSLIVEENTKIKNLIDSQKLKLPSDELERNMYWLAKKKLESVGYIHYEISNYAKKGYESKHNLDCWSQKEYLGFGVNASSFENNVRYSNTKNMNLYMKNIFNKNINANIQIDEKMNKRMLMDEYIMLGLRKIDGVNLNDFTKKFNENLLDIYKITIEKLLKEELIEINDDNIKLSNKGLDLANLVWEEFIE